MTARLAGFKRPGPAPRVRRRALPPRVRRRDPGTWTHWVSGFECISGFWSYLRHRDV